MRPGPANNVMLRLSLNILSYVRPRWITALALAATVIVEVAWDTLYPLGVKFLIDTAVASRDGTLFAFILGGLAAVFLVAALAGVAREHFSAGLGAAAIADLRAQVFRHLQRLSAGFYASREVGDLMTRFSGDLDALGIAFERTLGLALTSLLEVLVGVPLLFILDWRLSAVTLLVLPVSLIGPRLLSGRATQADYERKQLEGQLSSTAQETISGHNVIRAFSLSGVSQRRFERQLAYVARVSQRASLLERLVSRTTYIGVTFGQLAVIGVGAVLVLQQAMTIGTLIGFIGLLMGVGSSVSGFAAAVPEWLRAIAGMRRVDDILREEPQVRDRPGAFDLAPLHDEIRLERVAFSYGGQREALRGIDLTIPRGQTVALVGRSGSGKSTVFNLLTRFYEASDGVVSFDGHDLKHVTQESLRAQMGVVFQDAFLFKGSVADNIRLGKPDATIGEIESAARAAQIHDLIASWPEGYDTPVGERGGRLSGGQRQRVALARALIRNPGILLLDEATSALDPATEAAFNETLRQLSVGRTVVQVTHRLGGVVDADWIYVLDDGQVVDGGTHPQLLAEGGHYARLWRQQFAESSLSVDGRIAEITPARLRTMPVFSGLDDERLESLANRFSTEHVVQDRVVCEQGDPGDTFYVIVYGTVDVIRREENGTEERLNVLQEGDVFDEVALLNDAPRSATVRTRTPCVFRTLSRHQFWQELRSAPRLNSDLHHTAGSRRARTVTLDGLR